MRVTHCFICYTNTNDNRKPFRIRECTKSICRLFDLNDSTCYEVDYLNTEFCKSCFNDVLGTFTTFQKLDALSENINKLRILIGAKLIASLQTPEDEDEIISHQLPEQTFWNSRIEFIKQIESGFLSKSYDHGGGQQTEENENTTASNSGKYDEENGDENDTEFESTEESNRKSTEQLDPIEKVEIKLEVDEESTYVFDESTSASYNVTPDSTYAENEITNGEISCDRSEDDKLESFNKTDGYVQPKLETEDCAEDFDRAIQNDDLFLKKSIDDTNKPRSNFLFARPRTRTQTGTLAILKAKREKIKTSAAELKKTQSALKKMKQIRIAKEQVKEKVVEVVSEPIKKRNRAIVKITPPRFKCTAESCTATFPEECSRDAHVKRNHEGIKKPYDCSTCERSFKLFKDLEIHELIHSSGENKPLMCEHCGKRFVTRIFLKNHIQDKHTEEQPIKCSVCNKGFTQNYKLTQHLKTHSKELIYSCPHCPKKYACKNNLRAHMYTHTDKFTCTICGKKLSSNALLKSHTAAIHTKDFEFRCNICGYGTSFSSSFHSHMRAHDDTARVSCRICRNEFKVRNITEHKKIHNPERPRNFVCEVCGKCFIKAYHLKVHTQFHVGVKPFKCTICDQSYFSKFHLKTHMEYHAKCEKSGKKVRKRNMKKHLGSDKFDPIIDMSSSNCQLSETSN